MSDPSERSRRSPSTRLSAGSAASGLLGLSLFAVPLTVFLRGLVAQTSVTGWDGAELAVAALAVIALNGVFVAGETAIELVRSSQLKQVATDEKRTRILSDVLNRKPLLVAACFLGSQTMRAWLILITLPMALAAAPLVRSSTGSAPGWPSALLAGFLIGIPVVALNVVFGELVPRSYAVADPVRAVCRSYGFVKFFTTLFGPVAKVSLAVAGLLTRRFGAKASFSIANQAEEEIKERLEQAVETQEIEEEEKEMLHSVFEFGDTVAREIMTPRVDMDAVPVESSISEVAKIVEETGHSRIPVYEGSDDQIVGIVHAKDVLSAITRGETERKLREIMRQAWFVPENKNLHDLLQEMRQNRTQMVIVQDEFGGTSGVVTIEDIVEEVVGEIVDEYDREETQVVRDENGFTIGGKMNIHDVNSLIGTAFDSGEFDTLGGYVFGLFGRQPGKGENIESEGYRFTVADTDGRRILAIALERLDEAGEPEGALRTSEA